LREAYPLDCVALQCLNALRVGETALQERVPAIGKMYKVTHCASAWPRWVTLPRVAATQIDIDGELSHPPLPPVLSVIKRIR
jgi:hypothetical protein